MNRKLQEFDGVVNSLKEIAENAIVVNGELFVNASYIKELGDILTNLERCPYSAKVLFIESLHQLIGPFELEYGCNINAENSNYLFMASVRSCNEDIMPKWDSSKDDVFVVTSYSYCAEEALANIGVNLIKQYLINYGRTKENNSKHD